MAETSKVTAPAIVGWFGKSKFGKPNENAVRALAYELEKSRVAHQSHISDKNKKLRSLQGKLSRIRKAAKSLSLQLKDFERSAEKCRFADAENGLADESLRLEVATAVNGLAPFSDLPLASRGRDGEWIKSAARLAPWVAACLERPGKAPPSMTSPAGPVTAFLAEAIKLIYGQEIAPETIGRRLQEIGTRNILANHLARSSKDKIPPRVAASIEADLAIRAALKLRAKK